ncbi:trehalose 6-phosphate phosphatase [Nocardioides luteus]|uniref:Trehalose 6-phosphate phosphatase n=1 Tax=Nocardioides luteus TaxID=1844 RepID=A0ABQ5SXX2_9ACTN|nr:trehalose-phosphatase [Nocardioides luteus]MDR7312213.1 trehalose 6-phosphate phosphatase [Nocardioides luteus]GGR56752.1 trehalose 6-phosphate phosphatase [Nocardioides luteus]GLJ68460.1 trehalose 6-phosphate phosphatase [Nocardioides luteus]
MAETLPDGIAGEQKYAAVAAAAADALVGLDFDGTLSPIVEDPASARIHPDAAATLIALASGVKALAVVTGRPAGQVVELGGLAAIADALAEVGTELYVFGQYGNQRWSGSDRVVVGPPPPEGLAAFEAALPAVLEEHGASGAYLEEKGLAVGVHTRQLPEGTAHRLLPAITELAAEHGLVIEPGKQVIEVRAPGMHKGNAIETLVAEVAPGAILFGGDDLGDIEAFEAVKAWGRSTGSPTLLVYSHAGSDRGPLADLADLEVDGPDGVLELLRRLTADAAQL